MEKLKLVGYVFLAIVGITVFFSVGAAIVALGFLISVVLTSALFIGFITFLIKMYFDFRKKT
jgi:hypothetical protein